MTTVSTLPFDCDAGDAAAFCFVYGYGCINGPQNNWVTFFLNRMFGHKAGDNDMKMGFQGLHCSGVAILQWVSHAL